MKPILRLATAAAASLVATAAWAQDNDPIKIGVLATLEGTYTVLGEDSIRGFELALKEWNNEVAGRPIEYVVASTDTTPDTAVRQARKLVEQDEVDFIIGPLSGSEGIALRDYAKSVPQTTIINGISGAQETTWVDPAENFFRFNADGAQFAAGLGEYVVNEKGWKTVASVAEDYSFGYTNVLGFALGFCNAGGDIVERFWVPLGTKDFASVIAALPDDVDAVYLGLGGGDAINFLNQYQQAGGAANLIGGTIMVDQTVLTSRGRAKEALIGTPSAGPQADDWDHPRWQEFVAFYQESFPEDQRFPVPSLFATGYYNATTAAFKALEEAGGDLGNGHQKFREALAKVELDAPNGKITLDQNRQAIANAFITEVVEGPDGNLINKFVKVVESVNQTLGLSDEAFRSLGLPARDVPECKSYE
jgi:ABC-type branched-subunit amino acid transport system substrate-binding protein